MSLKDLVGIRDPGRHGPVCYEISLWAIAEQLPFELLRTGMWWVWWSSRQPDGTPRCDSSLPDLRPPTLLTPNSAAAFAAEFAERDDEFRRSMLIAGGENNTGEPVLDSDRLEREIEAFSKSADTRVNAVIVQVGDSQNEEVVVDSVPSRVVGALLEDLTERVGTRLDQLKASSGTRVLKRVLKGIRG